MTIVNEHNEGAEAGAVLKPVVRRTVNLHQLPRAGTAGPALMDPGPSAPPGLPEPGTDNPLPQGLRAQVNVLKLGQLLAGQCGAEILVTLPNQFRRGRTQRRALRVVRPPATVSGHHASRPRLAQAPHQALHLPDAQPKPSRTLALAYRRLHHRLNDQHPILFFRTQGNRLLCHRLLDIQKRT